MCLYGGTTDKGDITQQSHDTGEDDKHAGANIAEPLHHCFRRGDIQHTNTPTWASERIVSERRFSWKQGGNTGGRRKRERREGEVRGVIEIKYVRKSSCYVCQCVDPLWALPGDIRGDSRSHILHDSLNPVTTDSRGHG